MGQYFLSSLKQIWNMTDAQASQEVDELVRIGVFGLRLSKSELKIYSLPKIYKFTLNMVEESVPIGEA